MTYTRNPGQERARKNLLTAGKRYCLIYGGSRSGKTFELVGTIIERALLAPGSRHLIVRQEGTSAKRAIVKVTFPEVMRMRWPGVSYKWVGQEYSYFELPNGSQIWVGGLNDEKAVEKLLGNEYSTIYVNEASEVRYSAFTLLRTRLAQSVETIKGNALSQRFYVDLNPTTRQHWTYRLWIDGVDPESGLPVDVENYGWASMNPMDNAQNLSQEYLNSLRALPARAKKRFFDGNYIEDVEEALWRRSMIRRVQNVPDLVRVVVAVDPAVTNEAGSDETGIVCAGVDENGYGYVLDDASGRYRPEEWARQTLAVHDIHDADRIVAEVNQGGDMVENTIRAIRRDVSYKAVRASRGKVIRAEPIAALYERGKVFHVGEFTQLEDQMCFVAGTLIETERGHVPIEDVVAGDNVMTRAGLRPVKVARETGIAYSVVDIETTDGRRITCTPNHPIFVRGRFVPAQSVQVGDALLGSPNWESTVGQSSGAASGGTGCARDTSGTPKGSFFIGPFGRRTVERSPMDTIFTMSAAIRATIGSAIWSAFRLPSTIAGIPRAAGTVTAQSAATARSLGKIERGPAQRAVSVERSMRRRSQVDPGIALRGAGAKRDQPKRSWSVGAPIAGTPLRHAIQGECIAVARVTTRRITPESVYNLTVDGLPEYFANGMLVHNCTITTGFDRKAAGYSPDRVDALVWALTDLFESIASPRYADDEYEEEPEAWNTRNATTGY